MLQFPFDMFLSPEFLYLSLGRKVPHCLPSRYGYPCILMLPHQKPCPLLVCPHPGPDLCPLQITHAITWSSHLRLCSTPSSLNSARPELHPLQPASLCLSSWQQAMWQMKASKEGYPPLGLSFFVFVFFLRQCTIAFILFIEQILLSIYSVPNNKNFHNWGCSNERERESPCWQ